ncbi:MAG: hypothetical protein ACTHQM_25065 [Thermoanaerobaculia bacterium]
MIATAVLISVAVLLGFILRDIRRARRHQLHLQRENEAMQRELESHRVTAQSILRELQNV